MLGTTLDIEFENRSVAVLKMNENRIKVSIGEVQIFIEKCPFAHLVQAAIEELDFDLGMLISNTIPDSSFTDDK